MSRFQDLKMLFKRRLLTAAREHLIGDFETTISRYEKEIDRHRKLLDVVLNPDTKPRREAVFPADVQQLLVNKEEVPPQQQECSSSVDQEDPEPPRIKEEQEEVWTSQEGEQLQGLEEADITKFHSFTPVPVKSEDDEDKPQSSQLHQRHTEQMEAGADGEDCGAAEPARDTRDPDTRLQPVTDDETSDSSEPETEKDQKDPDRKPFRCSVCAKTFKHRGNLKIHMRSHTGAKPFSCSLCNKSFTQKASLDYHLKSHTGEKPYSCSVCGKAFRHRGAVAYHMAIHAGVKLFSCSVCKKQFRGISQLKAHTCASEYSWPDRSHGDKRKKPLRCSECNATFSNNYLLVTHMRMHKGKKLFTCSICGQKRQYSSHLEIHMRSHTGKKPYSCSVCGKTFSQRGNMLYHMAVHSGVKRFSCSVCSKRFFWQFQIKNHKCLAGFNREDCGGPEPARSYPHKRLKSHTYKKTEPSFETGDSDDLEFWKETRQHQTRFTYQRNKKVSVNDGHNTSKKPVSCSDDKAKPEPRIDNSVDGDFCKQTMQSQSGRNLLENEEVSVGDTGCKTPKKPFRSSECHERSEDSRTLLTHKKSHIGEKPYSCIVCEKRFTLESQLISHQCAGESSQLHTPNTLLGGKGKGLNCKRQLQVPIRSHTGLKPSGCSVCGKTFAKRESLYSHMTRHTREKPYCCSVCSAGFSDSESLVKHMRIHTEQTQFSCPICGEEFAWRRYLTKHMELHTEEKIYSCRVCNKKITENDQLEHHQCGGESLQLYQSETEENREAEPPASSSAQQMEVEADGKDCGGPEPARNSDPNRHPQLHTDDKTGVYSEPETVYSHFWKESIGHLAGLNSMKHEEVFQSDETGNNSHLLKIHRGAPELPHIKEEQEEVWTSQEGEQLQGLGEADVTKFPFTPVPVKSEDDEEKPQSSQLHQTHTEQMETVADGEDPDPHLQADTDDSVDSDFWKDTRERPSGLNLLKDKEMSNRSMGCCVSSNKALSSSDVHPSEYPEPESDDSVDSDFWKDDRKPQLGLNSLNSSDVLEHEVRNDTPRKPYSCPECGKSFLHIANMKNHMKHHTGEKVFLCSVCGLKCIYKSQLEVHMRTHTREKPFPCPVCGKRYAHKASMQSHKVTHTVEKQHSCRVCAKGFTWYTELKYHQCVGESSNENTYRRETM